MAKLIKGDSVQNIITDGDVIVTSPSKIGKTLGEVLNEQQSDINKLKSNVKYIYAYGGVGGSGSGGGSGSSEKPIRVLITLDGVEVNKNGSAIILDGRGKYKLYIKVSDAGGKNLFMGYTTNGSTVTDEMMFYSLNGDNKYKREIDIELNGNGKLNIALSDDEGNNIGYYSQDYIVDSDMFSVTLNYIDYKGETTQYTKEPYECFVTDLNKKDRHFKIDYSIFLPEYDKDSVNIECKIDGVGVIYKGSESKIIPIEGDNCEVFINKLPILRNENMGTYTLRATLSYKITGKEVVREKSFRFSVVPSSLYINVRTSGDVLYDDVGLLKQDIISGGGTPNKCISQGSSLMMYCKVFEGQIGSNPNTYFTTFTLFDGIVDKNTGNIIEWNDLGVKETETLYEQTESIKGVSVTFASGGIKKIEISTSDKSGIVKTFEKFVYVKEFKSECAWFDDKRHNKLVDSYFRANQGDDTYNSFYPLSSGNGVLSLTTSSDKIEITHPDWGEVNDNVCTIITFGIQVSNINSENAKIVDVYTKQSDTTPEYPLSTERLFKEDDSIISKIAIPTESLNKNKNSQYHLIQIIRNLAGYSKETGDAVYEDSLYIDGLLESVDRDTYMTPAVVSKIILNNINICYNLINIQYFSPEYNEGGNGDLVKFNPDGYAYQYWLSYKEKYVNSDSDVRLEETERFIKENMHRIFFDGTNVVVDQSIVVDIALRSDLPTVIFSYNCESGGESSISEFMEDMWMGRANGDKSFGNKKIELYWIPERSGGDLSDYKVIVPTGFKDASDQTMKGEWEISLQGTSTMRNRIKNYSLRIKSNSDDGKILFSPKFNIEDKKTFLPDLEWTIKADIADSAHANNTSIGKFVNTVCTKIDTNIPDGEPEATDFIKNTLEGIPVLMYFMCHGKDENGNNATKIYYFGIYNFNLGRSSHYNLGYTGGIVDGNMSDFMKVYNNIKEGNLSKYYQDKVFTFAVGEGSLSPNIAIGEIQDNYPQFDFHQYDETLLFKTLKNDNACMFGDESKITAANIGDAQKALSALVKGVAKAGKRCFEKVRGTNAFVTSRYFDADENGNPILDSDGNIVYGNKCVNRYELYKIPDTKWQMSYTDEKYEDGSNIYWYESTLCDNVTDEDLKKLITTYVVDGVANKPILNFTSASEYYTICMAFGMVDSVLKNMNLKNFKSESEGYEFYCAFYDMDCALEEANDGQEKVTYLAATDYWYSDIDGRNKVGQIKKKPDYWPQDAGFGFDFTSSYLFAVVKYAKPIFESYPSTEDKYEADLRHYPQNFWAALRNPEGELRSAKHFVDNYFKSGISTTFEYLASLNYRVKYLFYGETPGGNDTVIERYLANVEAFNGSRKVKVKNWLSKRLRFMDLMMNVNNLNAPLSDDKNGLYIPGPGNEYKDKLPSNTDITILQSAFDSNDKNTAITSFTSDVKVYAPKHTPFIFTSGNANGHVETYLLPGGMDKPNIITLNVFKDIGTHFYGSGLFTSVDKIESMFTSYRSIISENLEKITYGNTNVSSNSGTFTINAPSVTEIDLNIPGMGGELTISKDCISLMKINIAKSKFFGKFQDFPNLQEVNISGVNSSYIYVSGSNFLTGERFRISGLDDENKTTLTTLNISGVTGNFECKNTSIEEIIIQNNTDRDSSDFTSDMLSEFSITGDSRLKRLTLIGFRKVSIENCVNLVDLVIDDALEELYIDLKKVKKDEVTSQLKKIALGSTTDVKDGVFDFTKYPNLNRVTLMNCDHLEHVKFPDRDIETDGMNDNLKLQWIDTGILPAFLDVDNDGKVDGYINDAYGRVDENGDLIKYPTYSVGSKLILCSDGVFRNCPNYTMLRSDYNKAKELINVSSSRYPAYTNIIVSDKCTSLSDTFYMSGSSTLDAINSDTMFNMKTAIRFIEKCVPDEVKKNITSLSGCFRGRQNVSYTIIDANNEKGYSAETYATDHRHPMLEKYESVDNISSMYENTGVIFISKFLLDLPYSKNTSDNPLYWDNFIQGMSRVNVTDDALYNVSYRLQSYSYINFTIYEYEESGDREYKVAGMDGNVFKICDFFYPFENGKSYTEDGKCVFADDIKRYDNIYSLNSLNFYSEQCIDFRGMFELFPNIQSLTSFLNGKLSNYNIQGLLKPCTNLKQIIQSFCDSNINDPNNHQVIDLFEFFNWDGNTPDIENLFDSTDFISNGFTIKKTISYDNFKHVLEKIEGYTKLTRITNLFSYCTITGYETHKDEDIAFSKPLNNITNISNLFDSCTSDYSPFAGVNGGDKGVYTGGVLKIGRPFFKQLPLVTVLQRTLANTYLSTSLTYDYFGKRGDSFEEFDVLLSENSDDKAKLYECKYNSDIINLKECFYNTKFVNCKNWFDDKDNKDIEIKRNHIISDKTYDERGFVYYVKNESSGFYDKFVLDNDAIDDCLDNYTDFIPRNEILNSKNYIWYNHDLYQDFKYYGNIKDGNKPFDPENEACVNTIQKTYCCLPPDFLYGCSDAAQIDGIFANSNIIGVIPRNLTKKIKSKSISNIFRNVNIMPNLEYYYDVNGSFNALLFEEIKETVDIDYGSDSDSDNDIISDNYTVVFRDEYGRLKRRKPVKGDRNLGQFVYVPANFTKCGSIMNSFNFRYNLPRHWELGKDVDKNNVGHYKSTFEFDEAIKEGNVDTTLLPYHSQYYFLMDNSVKWDNLYDAKHVFISNEQDIDFSNINIIGRSREYYDDRQEVSIKYKNAWTEQVEVSTPTSWTANNLKNFNIDLNLCGKKNEYNMIEDNGCPVVYENRSVHLDYFVSGILTVFLNGRVFDSTFEISKLTTSYHKSSGSSMVIGYYGFGKNIILPNFNGYPSDPEFVFIPIDEYNIIYYDFMLNNNQSSINNYYEWFAKDRGYGKDYLFETQYNKYTFK